MNVVNLVDQIEFRIFDTERELSQHTTPDHQSSSACSVEDTQRKRMTLEEVFGALEDAVDGFKRRNAAKHLQDRSIRRK